MHCWKSPSLWKFSHEHQCIYGKAAVQVFPHLLHYPAMKALVLHHPFIEKGSFQHHNLNYFIHQPNMKIQLQIKWKEQQLTSLEKNNLPHDVGAQLGKSQVFFSESFWNGWSGVFWGKTKHPVLFYRTSRIFY